MKKWERSSRAYGKVKDLKETASKEIGDAWVSKYEDGSYIIDCQTCNSVSVYYVHVSSSGKIMGNGAIKYRDDIMEKIQEFERR